MYFRWELIMYFEIHIGTYEFWNYGIKYHTNGKKNNPNRVYRLLLSSSHHFNACPYIGPSFQSFVFRVQIYCAHIKGTSCRLPKAAEWLELLLQLWIQGGTIYEGTLGFTTECGLVVTAHWMHIYRNGKLSLDKTLRDGLKNNTVDTHPDQISTRLLFHTHHRICISGNDILHNNTLLWKNAPCHIPAGVWSSSQFKLFVWLKTVLQCTFPTNSVRECLPSFTVTTTYIKQRKL